MIERLLVKDHISFKTVDLEFEPGLIAFTGASGTGKSILMRALLTLFGLEESDASLIEGSLNATLDLEKMGIESENPNILRCVKQKSARYFVNSQMLSRKNIAHASRDAVRYLSAKEGDELSFESLLKLLDSSIKSEEFIRNRANFKPIYQEFLKAKTDLEQIESEERRVEELKEFARFEIQKIEEINPKIGEDEELMSTKKMLSRKEKLKSALESASIIFEAENAVYEALSLSETESNFFDSCMNELRAHLENASSKLLDLEEANIEEILDRIEKISALKTRFGTIEEIHAHLKKRKDELTHYENIAFEKKDAAKLFEKLNIKVKEAAKALSNSRKEALSELEKRINKLLDALYLEDAKLELKPTHLSETGVDELHVSLVNVSTKNISSGELNRLRLAFIATSHELGDSSSGVLILDEIDANLSGKEAMSVAKVLVTLAQKYQIFAISHQPQLSSRANQHFLVEKIDGESSVRLLSNKERVLELARMISGENITVEAREFALSLLNEG